MAPSWGLHRNPVGLHTTDLRCHWHPCTSSTWFGNEESGLWHFCWQSSGGPPMEVCLYRYRIRCQPEVGNISWSFASGALRISVLHAKNWKIMNINCLLTYNVCATHFHWHCPDWIDCWWYAWANGNLVFLDQFLILSNNTSFRHLFGWSAACIQRCLWISCWFGNANTEFHLCLDWMFPLCRSLWPVDLKIGEGILIYIYRRVSWKRLKNKRNRPYICSWWDSLCRQIQHCTLVETNCLCCFFELKIR